MGYTQTYHTEKPRGQFAEIVEIETHIKDSIAVANSPFKSPRFSLKIKRAIHIFMARLCTLIIGRQMYCVDELGSLRALSPEARSLLTWLTEHNYIAKWRYSMLTPGYPTYATFFISPTKITSPRGNTYMIGGATGNGSGNTLNEAVLPALGEFIERLASSSWGHRNDFVTGSYTVLKQQGAVDPLTFLRYNKEQLATDEFSQHVIAQDSKLKWLPVENFVTADKNLLPASICYSFYNADNPEEPVFGEINSNGAAAQSTIEKATYGAILELLERDAFLRAWHHNKVCQRVSLKSLHSKLADALWNEESLKERGISISIVDVTSDIGIPTFASIATNPKGSYTIAVSASADLDVTECLGKLVRESVRFLHGSPPKVTAEEKEAVRSSDRGIGIVDGFHMRHKVWSQPEMIPAVSWFTEGEEVDLESILTKYADFNGAHGWSTDVKLNKIKTILREKNIDLYVVDLSNQFTKRAGLKVVRAISPQLLPMFFNERRRPLGMPRFTEDAEGNKITLNPVPHPFI